VRARGGPPAAPPRLGAVAGDPVPGRHPALAGAPRRSPSPPPAGDRPGRLERRVRGGAGVRTPSPPVAPSGLGPASVTLEPGSGVVVKKPPHCASPLGVALKRSSVGRFIPLTPREQGHSRGIRMGVNRFRPTPRPSFPLQIPSELVCADAHHTAASVPKKVPHATDFVWDRYCSELHPSRRQDPPTPRTG
jgi:hypothetical protein